MYPSEKYPHFGVFVRNVCDGLVAEGNQCQVVAIQQASSNVAHKLMLYGHFYFSALWMALTRKFDIVYVHFPSHSFLPIWIASWLRGQKIVLNFHGGDGKLHKGRSAFFFKIKRYFNQKAIDMAKLVVVPSQPYADEIAGLYDLCRVRIFVSPSGGVNLKLFGSDVDRHRHTEAPLNVAFVGRLVNVKRPDIFASCVCRYFERSFKRRVTFSIVGNGALRDQLSMLLEPFPVTFIDALSQEDLSVFYKTTDVIVQCSETESLGLVVIEAMVSQCLPLCIANPAYRYLVEEPGLLFYSEDDFVDKLERLIDMSSAARAELANKLAKEAAFRFSQENVIKGLHNAFSQL